MDSPHPDGFGIQNGKFDCDFLTLHGDDELNQVFSSYIISRHCTQSSLTQCFNPSDAFEPSFTIFRVVMFVSLMFSREPQGTF